MHTHLPEPYHTHRYIPQFHSVHTDGQTFSLQHQSSASMYMFQIMQGLSWLRHHLRCTLVLYHWLRCMLQSVLSTEHSPASHKEIMGLVTIEHFIFFFLHSESALLFLHEPIRLQIQVICACILATLAHEHNLLQNIISRCRWWCVHPIKCSNVIRPSPDIGIFFI